MITVRLIKDSNNRLLSFIVSGHASYDGICAAVSCLTQTTASALHEILNHRIRILSADGYFKVTFVQLPTKNCQLLIDTMLLGLKKIQRKYHGLVQIVEQRKEEK